MGDMDHDKRYKLTEIVENQCIHWERMDFIENKLEASDKRIEDLESLYFELTSVDPDDFEVDSYDEGNKEESEENEDGEDQPHVLSNTEIIEDLYSAAIHNMRMNDINYRLLRHILIALNIDHEKILQEIREEIENF
jgi:hypothetical protein